MEIIFLSKRLLLIHAQQPEKCSCNENNEIITTIVGSSKRRQCFRVAAPFLLEYSDWSVAMRFPENISVILRCRTCSGEIS